MTRVSLREYAAVQRARYLQATRAEKRPLPPPFFGVRLFMIVTYLAFVEVVKRWFYRRYVA